MNARLESYLNAHLIQGGQDCVPYQLMSDEELVAVESEGDYPYVTRPWIESQDDIDGPLAARFGERSLLMRGLLEVDTDGDEPRIEISEDLQFVADTRRDAAAYILAKAMFRDETRACTYALQQRIGGFEEEIDAEGFHLFTACTYAAAMRRLATWALPGVNHQGAEARTRVPSDRWGAWIANELGLDSTFVEINLFLPDGDTTTPETWLLAHAHGVGVLATAENDTMYVSSSTTSRLETRLLGRVTQALGVSL